MNAPAITLTPPPLDELAAALTELRATLAQIRAATQATAVRQKMSARDA